MMYRVPLVPGPTTVPAEIRAVYAEDYPSGDLDPGYVALYVETERRLQQLLGCIRLIEPRPDCLVWHKLLG